MTKATFLFESLDDQLISHVIQGLLVVVLSLVVITTSKAGKPRVRDGATEYRPAWGTKIVLWITIALWTLMAWASIDVGLPWLAFLLMMGPVLTLWRWPAAIVVDEVRIRAVAPLRGEVSIHWIEVKAVEPSGAGDALIVRSRGGQRIKVPFTQVGAEELVEIIGERTGVDCKYEEPAVY